MRSRSVSWIVRSAVAALFAALLMPLQPASAAEAPYIFRYRPAVITDPSASVTARGLPIRFSGPSTITSARWLLHDSGGAPVLDEPAEVTAGDTPSSWRARFFPTIEAGTVLPDGRYTLWIQTTNGSGTQVSNPIEVDLAHSPPAAVPTPTAPVSDVVPSGVDSVRAEAAVTPRMLPGLGFGAIVPDGVFTVRNAAGRAVQTQRIAAWCPSGNDGIYCLHEENITTEGAYFWQWDGRVGGAQQPAGRYTLTASLPDRFGRIVSVNLGSFWIRHLATVTGVRKWTAAAQSTYQRVGTCSSVSQPGPHGWAGSIGLLSLSHCRSTAGTDDLAALSFRFTVDGTYVERVTSWRLDAYGGGVRSGMTATLLGMTSSGWQRSAVLGREVGWHNGTTRTSGIGSWSVSSAGDRRLVVNAQAQAINGSRYSVKYVRTVLTYRAWVR